MAATLYDASAIQDNDRLAALDRREAVGDDEDSAPFHKAVHATLDDGLGPRVDAARRLVHDHHRRICHGGTGNGQQLALAGFGIGVLASVFMPPDGRISYIPLEGVEPLSYGIYHPKEVDGLTRRFISLLAHPS